MISPIVRCEVHNGLYPDEHFFVVIRQPRRRIDPYHALNL